MSGNHVRAIVLLAITTAVLVASVLVPVRSRVFYAAAMVVQFVAFVHAFTVLRRGECPKCGDIGPVSALCRDCGCAAYR